MINLLPVPYVRELQQKRLRVAERELNLLGRVNPLALEEFDALESDTVPLRTAGGPAEDP
jgi:chromosome segregation ATPase